MLNLKILIAFFLLLFLLVDVDAQNSCMYSSIINSMKNSGGSIDNELKENEIFTKTFIEKLILNKQLESEFKNTEYVIPVVLHVFHNGDDGKIDFFQAQSDLDRINEDFNGLNDGWNTIDEQFDSIKATINIEFKLAKTDPNGNITTGIIYYDNETAMLNQTSLYSYAWNNYKYLNIYLPKYTEGGPSPNNFTAYATFPSTSNSNNNSDGVTYSSIRWGFGALSELKYPQDWASVGTHEVGHWLNLRHTFDGSCSSTNDFVDDTPPTKGGTIELSGCYNNDFSCGESTNGSNYMDYNHDCKKMFTQGQVNRMLAALQLESRKPLWSYQNLIATGIIEDTTTVDENIVTIEQPTNILDSTIIINNSRPTTVNTFNNLLIDDVVNISPNPVNELLFINGIEQFNQLNIYAITGKLIKTVKIEKVIEVAYLDNGLYFAELIKRNGARKVIKFYKN